jgi:hypothetical protein
LGVGRSVRIERRALSVPRGALVTTVASVAIGVVIAMAITHGAR